MIAHSDAKTFYDSLLARGFTFAYNDGAPVVCAPVDNTDRLNAEDKTTLARLRAEILDLIEPPMLRPRLTADGELRIPWQAHPRFHHWAGGQSLWTTLAELNAPVSVVRKYTIAVGKLHSGLQQCSGRVVELAELAYCQDCGWREEAAA